MSVSLGVSVFSNRRYFYLREDFAMPTISKKEYEEYKSLCYDRNHGRILTPDGLRLICEGLNRDPEAIGKHMLETLAKMRQEKSYGF